MASMPLAFSIHNFISSVGADAGFAAIIGLAILVLLYFAHARETANLREEAALLTQRLMQAEARVAQLSRVQPAPAAPAAAPVAAAPRPVASASPALGAMPFAPAGVGAPALAAATRVVPLARVPSPPVVTPRSPQPSPAQPQVPAPAIPAAMPQPPVSRPLERQSPAAAPVAAPAAATVAGANGAGHEPAFAAPVGVGEGPPPSRPPTPRGSPAASRRQPLPPPRAPAPRRSRVGRGFAVLIGAVGVAAVIAVLVIATSGGSGSTSSTTSARTTNAPSARRPRTPAPFTPSAVTVAVLNGTNTNQLAHTVGAKLAALGYKEGALRTAASQTQTSTVVSYFPGARNRTDAVHVATALKLGPASVQPIDQSTQQVACPSTTPCTANVVVTVGADLSTL